MPKPELVPDAPKPELDWPRCMAHFVVEPNGTGHCQRVLDHLGPHDSAVPPEAEVAPPEPKRHPISREAADALKALSERRAQAAQVLAIVDAEAGQFVTGLALGLGIDAARVMGVDDGEEPALLLTPEEGAQPPA